jgi:amino acid adenylation domain-containing protein
MVAGLLGVLKAGAAFTMLDVEYPVARLAGVLGQVGARVVVCDAVRAEALAGVGVRCVGVEGLVADESLVPAGAGAGGPVSGVGAGDAAVVMFTSGSTGTPKGIITPHSAIVATTTAQDFVRSHEDQVWLQCAPVSWDAFVTELFYPLLSGGTVVLYPGAKPDPAVLAELLESSGATTLECSASLFNYLIDEFPEQLRGLRHLMTGGEAASPAHTRRALELYPGITLTNGYGPVESMGYSTAHHITAADPADRPVPIGPALNNKILYVLDESLRPVPVGVPGEVYMGGSGLGWGYVGRGGLSGERFVACPFGVGVRMYRTGDVGVVDAGGVVRLLGRGDDQVKVRGFRVEPGEVERVVGGFGGVVRVAVVVREDVPGDRRLVAYVVPGAGCAVDVGGLREYVAGLLPGFMVPSGFVVVDELPLTANGKLDRAALPAPDYGAGVRGAAPRDEREAVLCAVFARVLGLGRVGIDDDFFHLGGHSLLATQLVSQACAAFDAELTVQDVFDAPTVARLAPRIRPGRRRAALTALGQDARERLPLSFAQQRLWLIDRIEGPSSTYNVPFVLEIEGALDVAAFEGAVGDLVARHESLRTTIEDADGTSWQRIHPPHAGQVPFAVTDCAPDELDGLIDAAIRQPFDLSHELPVRVWVFGVGAGRWVVVLLLHHIVCDGWSQGPLARDLAAAYRARTEPGGVPGLGGLPVQYGDYAVWQRQTLGAGTDPDSIAGRDLAYWRDTLADAPEGVWLGADHPRPATPTGHGAIEEFALDAATHAGLESLARSCGATLFMVVHTALAALLTRTGAGHDILIGTPVAGRSEPGLEDMIGFFVNTLPLRVDTSGDPSLRDLLARIRRTDLEALAHQELPFDRLIEEINPARTPGTHPLFQILLAFEHHAPTPPDLPTLTTSWRDTGTHSAKFDLDFGLRATHDHSGNPTGITGHTQYATDLYTPETIQALTRRLLTLLRAAATTPDTPISHIDLLTDAEKHLLLVEYTDTAHPYPDHHSIPELVLTQAAATPDAPALICGPDTWTYRDLAAYALTIAQSLTDAGVAPGQVVAACLPRGPRLTATMLGIMTARTVFLNLDPDYPPTRLTHMLTDTHTATLITDPGLTDHLPVSTPRHHPPAQPPTTSPALDPATLPRPDDLAYLIYTSGTTGTPKAVMIEHRALSNRLQEMRRLYQITHHDRTLQYASLSFDASLEQTYPTLTTGGTLILRDDDKWTPHQILHAIDTHRITLAELTPTLWTHLLDHLDQGAHLPDSLRLLILGGETVAPGHVQRWFTHTHTPIHNTYGPTETTITATAHLITHPTPVIPIGKPVANTHALILDPHTHTLQPPGTPGELCIGGTGLARGYLNNPHLTTQKFIPHPTRPGQLLYTTGDLARWQPDGTLTHHGRTDTQIKIRGFRIEPTEIQNTLTQHPKITTATITPHQHNNTTHLIAYITTTTPHPENDPDLTPTNLRTWTRQHLPDHLTPTTFIHLHQLPTTPTGKINHTQLPKPDFASLSQGREPETDQQRALCAVFAATLKLERVSIDDNFFELGGHSLLATRVVSKARSELGAELTVRDLFNAPTVAALSELLARPAAAPRPQLAARRR